MDACECNVTEAGFCCCVYFSGQVPCSDFSCTFCLSVAGGRPHLSPVLLSLAEVLGFYPVTLWVRGRLEAGQSITQSLGSPPLAVFFLLSAAALASLSSGSSEQKALG